MKTKIMFLLTAVLLASCSSEPANAQTEMKTYKINLQVAGKTLTATLDDNATTRAFLGRLPMTLPMMDLYGREMCYRFPDALPTDDARTQGYEVGEIVYYPPMHSFVIMYLQNGERFEMQKLGRMDGGVETFEGIGDIDVTFSLVETSGNEACNASERQSVVHDLHGRRLQSPPSAGIYISNGKKLFRH